MESAATEKSYRQYLSFWFGQISTLLGSTIVHFSIVWWITVTTKSTLILSISMVISFLPQIITFPFAGVFADLWDRKKTIIFSDFFQAMTTLIMIIFFITGNANIWLVISMNGLRGIFQAFHEPAAKAIIPIMVPKDKLSRINSIINLSTSLSWMIGPVFAASLMGFFSIQQMLWIDIISFAFAIVLLLRIDIPSPNSKSKSKSKIKSKSKNGVKSKNTLENGKEDENQNTNLNEKEKLDEKISFFKELKIGFITLKEAPGFLAMALTCAGVNFLLVPFNVLLPYFVNVTHSGDETNMAFISLIFNLGMIISSLLSSIKKEWKHKVLYLLIGVVFMCIGNIISALSPTGSFMMIAIGRFTFGFAICFVNMLYYTLLQLVIPQDKQGRVFSIDAVISLASTPIAILLSNPLIEFLGIVNFFIYSSILAIIITVSVIFSGITKINYEEITN